MKDQLISFETAKLAKEKGFQLQRNYFGYIDKFYHPITQCIRSYGMTGRTNKGILIYIPTQSLLQKWLREVHNLHIVIFPEFYTTGINYTVQILCYDPTSSDCYNNDKCTGMYGDNGEYPTYEFALEFGLYEALKLINNES
jgi:hypothetical protein